MNHAGTIKKTEVLPGSMAFFSTHSHADHLDPDTLEIIAWNKAVYFFGSPDCTVGVMALSDNPYDGHTLGNALEQVEQLTGHKPEQATCELGYRRHKDKGPCHVEIVSPYRKAVPGVSALARAF